MQIHSLFFKSIIYDRNILDSKYLNSCVYGLKRQGEKGRFSITLFLTISWLQFDYNEGKRTVRPDSLNMNTNSRMEGSIFFSDDKVSTLDTIPVIAYYE